VTRITYLSKLIGIPSLAAFLKLELFRVYLTTPEGTRLFLARNCASTRRVAFFSGRILSRTPYPV
ncbi:hypothetical protein D5076_01325, partial [Pectobacterium versatile]